MEGLLGLWAFVTCSSQLGCPPDALLYRRGVQPHALGPAWRPLCLLDFIPPLALLGCSLPALPWAG